MLNVEQKTERLIRKPELFNRIGLSDATIWRLEKAGSFPKRVQLGGNSVGWFESEVDAWFEEKAAQREQAV